MELRNIFTFLRAAELGSFSKAANSLGYAQSTVTIQIQQLEDELGKPLFDRFNRSIQLTSFGEIYLPLAQRVYNTIQEMQSLNVDPQELTGVLRLGIVESLFYSDFLQLIPKYQAMFPNIILDFHTASSVEIIDLLKKGKLDLGCYLVLDTPPIGFSHFFCRPSSLVFVANQNHAFSPKETLSLEQISQEKFILTEEISVYHQALSNMLNSRKLSIREGIRLKSTRGIIDVLKYSGGISFLPEYAVHQEIKQGYLKVLSTEYPSMDINVVISTCKEKWISPQMQGLLQLLLNENWF